ncbi:MAG: peptidoglycan-associated lipoprotein Pal [Alcanivoracaceae bacterium]|jgi:peptidoglycan-associated lipoprotein|nr:peptidoglycan-associated lipoprotein Pal [Alcanivoracaceae bacterium]
MSAFASKSLFAVLLASTLVACSSKPTDDQSGDVQSAPVAPQSEVSAVDDQQAVQAQQSAISLTAENFHNHPSNYDGTTSSRVIYFAFDNASVPAAAFDTLRAHANYLKGNSNAKVRLEGHADERGTREYNVALAERRAQSVEKFLRVQGVSAAQIEMVSYGEEKPAAYGSDQMSWAKNRRVELNYLSGRP